MCSPSQLYKLPSKFAQAVSVPVNQHSGSKLAMMLVATIFRHWAHDAITSLKNVQHFKETYLCQFSYGLSLTFLGCILPDLKIAAFCQKLLYLATHYVT